MRMQTVVVQRMLDSDDTKQSSKFSDAALPSEPAALPLEQLNSFSDDLLAISSRGRRAFYHGPGGATGSAARGSLTVRDAIAWASFCQTVVHAGQLSAWAAYVHGAYLTLLDGLGLGLGLPEATARQLRASCEQFLRTQLPSNEQEIMLAASFKHLPVELGRSDGADDPGALSFGAGPFRVQKVRTSQRAPMISVGHQSACDSVSAGHAR